MSNSLLVLGEEKRKGGERKLPCNGGGEKRTETE